MGHEFLCTRARRAAATRRLEPSPAHVHHISWAGFKLTAAGSGGVETFSVSFIASVTVAVGPGSTWWLMRASLDMLAGRRAPGRVIMHPLRL
jgi:hypothetical protein